jgi:hypothetical protein
MMSHYDNKNVDFILVDHAYKFHLSFFCSIRKLCLVFVALFFKDKESNIQRLVLNLRILLFVILFRYLHQPKIAQAREIYNRGCKIANWFNVYIFYPTTGYHR